MKLICPECKAEFVMCFKELEKEKLSFQLKYEGEFLQAKTVGGMITHFDILLKEVAKASGLNVMVAFAGFEQGDHELTVHFMVSPKNKK
jgi:hypothetical protein